MKKKKVLTKAMKIDIMDIIKRYIKTKNPQYNDKELVENYLNEAQEKMQQFVNNFELPKDEKEKELIKKYIRTYNLYNKRCACAFGDLWYFDFDDEEVNKNKRRYDINIVYITLANYNMPNDFLFLYEDKKDTFEYQKIKQNIQKQGGYRSLADCYADIYREMFVADFVQKYKELKKEYRNILTKFESIVYGTKYAVDLLEVINIPEVKTYIENQLKSDCTALSCVSQDTIDFVKNYLSTTEEKDVD